MSELNLEEQVGLALQGSPYLRNRSLRFETSGGRVVLKGVVQSYYQKQMAQETVRRLDGVEGVENELEVDWVA